MNSNAVASSSRHIIPKSSSSTDLTFLSTLNSAQLKAVKQDPEVPLQILAGPGSGKTKVLTSRIAYLILNHGIPASSICAVTFTNKAANEMKARLANIIGKQRTAEVKMGTFHALCAMFLRKYPTVVGLKRNFTVCDADESKKLISKLLQPYKEYLSSKDISLKEGTVLSIISKAKAKGKSAESLSLEMKESGKDRKSGISAQPDDIHLIAAEIYESYELALRKSNSLDFDDLLLFGVKLFTAHEKAVSWCQHLLVDEFQDTNTTQYELMRAIAVARCVTIVGDPDQSIYGWRSAEVENLSKMKKDFLNTKQVFLEQNYRSTAAILTASLAIVSEDKLRVQKSLRTTHPLGTHPVLSSFQSEHEEAAFIAVEIKRLMAHMGGLLYWGDFVILLRFNALSRAIESALQKEAIPNRVLGGHKFFERLEIKDLLAYLQLTDNTSYNPAFVRAINVPSRGIGDKTLAEIAARAEKTNLSQLAVIENIYDGKVPDIKPPVKRKLDSFVKAIRCLRDLAEKDTSPADLIRRLLELTNYENHLKKTQPDWESRWENVQELVSFATEAETNPSITDQYSEGVLEEAEALKDTPLRTFLQASMLSSEGDNQTEEDSKDKVTISTCHAAKGLEWPVVFVPSVEQGTFPFYRTEDLEEERRLLYVACTRAQSLLYLSHAAKRKVAGDSKAKELSEFVSSVMKQNTTLFASQAPRILSAERSVVAKVLGRAIPNEAEVQKRVAEFERTTRHVQVNNSWLHKGPLESTKSAPINTIIPARNIFRNAPSNASNAFKIPVATSTHLASSSPTARVVPSFHHQPVHYHQIPRGLSASVSNQNLPPAFHNPSFSNSTLGNTNSAASCNIPTNGVNEAGVKRRLGMGRITTDYSNKKFKRP